MCHAEEGNYRGAYLHITEGITANIFHMINSLAVESGREHITGEAVENWEPEFDADAAFA